MSQNRREFIKAGSVTATAMMLSSFDFLPAPAAAASSDGFALKVLATNWGFRGSVTDYCEKVKKEGYDGIEIWWPQETKDRDELFNALAKYNLEVGFLCGGWQPAYAAHLDFFKQSVNAAARNTVQRPLYINCHSGRDFFSFGENCTFIDHTTALTRETGIKILHETHRSRMLFAAPVARTYMEKRPDLHLTLDISHWCNVSESLLADQSDTVNMALQRTRHIHARIGHPEGPQVNDPRAPEWEAACKAHFAWWDKVVEIKKEKGEVLTVLTEFGPPHYMPALPYTMQPLSDQWAINVYMMQTIRKRYLS